ncbi:MAG TPA: hypothetical protein VEO00_02520 [Actinomycetota bacterium]|nr:hypothetical protein [Actinomycetota bacterium]
MDIVKIRRVGNSNVISLPKSLEGLGYVSGTSVVVEELDSGELRVVPVSKVRELIREVGRRVVAENREALQILERHDSQGSSPAGRSRARRRIG